MKSIKLLILNTKYRKNLQELSGFKNIKHLIKDNSKLIDQIREEC